MYWYLRSRCFEWIEQRRVRHLFYSNQRFQTLDQTLLSFYQIESPYAISKAFLLGRGAPDPYLYGETPLTTMDQIARHFELTCNDCLIEMGAGRYRASLFLAEVIGCRVIAIEEIPRFVQIAKQINCPRLTVLEGDFFQADLSKASVIYLYGSHLNEREIMRLQSTFQQLPSNVKILTVSAPLPDFKVVDQMTGRFPWGKTQIYWNQYESLSEKMPPLYGGNPCPQRRSSPNTLPPAQQRMEAH